MKILRIQKYIASCGVSSRRKAEELISAGKVKLNGKVVTLLGTKMDPEADVVAVEGQIVRPEAVEKIYIVFYKPRSVVTTLSDPEGRKTVRDFFPMIKERIYPVGRLDYHSEGLLILTNDGGFTHRIMHPSFQVEKVYEVKVFGAVTAKILRELKKEHRFEGGVVRPRSVRVVKQLPQKTWLEFRLGEGRNREIRRLCEAVGLTVEKLKRVAIGGLSVQGLTVGNFYFASKRELDQKIGLHGGQFQKYTSKKRTIDVRVKKPRESSRLADDPYYRQYRKEHYQKTIANRTQLSKTETFL